MDSGSLERRVTQWPFPKFVRSPLRTRGQGSTGRIQAKEDNTHLTRRIEPVPPAENGQLERLASEAEAEAEADQRPQADQTLQDHRSLISTRTFEASFERLLLMGKDEPFLTVAQDRWQSNLILARKITGDSIERKIHFLQQFQHPTLLKLLNIFVTGSEYTAVYEYMDISMREVLLSPVRLTESQVAHIVRCILECLQYLHRMQNVTHGNIGPECIWLRLDGSVRLGKL